MAWIQNQRIKKPVSFETGNLRFEFVISLMYINDNDGGNVIDHSNKY
jgi:hypothetical protein